MDNVTNAYSFADRLLTPTHIVCGVELRPFSLGHWSFLDLYASPLLSADLYPELVSDDMNEQFGFCIRHVLLLVIVCAHSYEGNRKMYDDSEYSKEVLAEFEEGLFKYIKKTENWNIYREIAAVREYLDYYINSMPNFSEKGPPSPPSGMDWKANLYAIMKNEYGYTESEIMNMSIRRVYAEWVSFAVKSGAIEVKSKQQLEAEAKAHQQAVEYAEKIRKTKMSEKNKEEEGVLK